MGSKVQKQYGSWPSQLSASVLASSSSKYGHLTLENGIVYWLESLPEEAGRVVIYSGSINATPKIITPQGFSVRSRAHEYGGADFSVKNSTIIFCNDADQRLYLQRGDVAPRAITPATEFKHAIRYADIEFSKNQEWIICVRERHASNGKPLDVVNDLVRISLKNDSEPKVLAEGADFYSYPRISPDGHKLVWTCWQHPNMPWDQTALWTADIDKTGRISNSCCLIDNDNESIFQPSWSPDGELHFVSDRNGWWNIYSFGDQVLNELTPINAEFGYPQWQFGTQSYTFVDGKTILSVFVQNGLQHLCLIDSGTGIITPIDLPFCTFQGGLCYEDNQLYFIAASPKSPSVVIAWDLKEKMSSVISQSKAALLGSEDISPVEAITFPTTNSKHAHAFYYPPKNAHYCGLNNEKSPLIVMSHGGPTSATTAEYNINIQFWTNRGFAVVDVNYGGSTGFGREYRERLKGQWGIVDVDDCINAAKYLVERGDVDGDRLAIRGGSAGGYTTYRALINYSLFSAGVSRYGVADLSCLVKESHKFEVRYLDSLIGPWPKEKALYHSRSPINHASKFNCPVLLLQGDEDAVVPPAQSQAMAMALDKKQIPHSLLMLEGEQHGFRRSENIRFAIEMELNFYSQVFQITPVDKLPDLELKHKQKLKKFAAQ